MSIESSITIFVIIFTISAILHQYITSKYKENVHICFFTRIVMFSYIVLWGAKCTESYMLIQGVNISYTEPLLSELNIFIAGMLIFDYLYNLWKKRKEPNK